MKTMVAGRGAPMWGMGWSGFAVVMIAALCLSVLHVFRHHPRAGDGKIMTYGLGTAMAAPTDVDMDRTMAPKS
ncbi:MAG: hypothetical protein ACYC1L_06145 [Alphaproteobacteria bacterium]